MISKQDIEDAHQRIKPYIHKTPIISSESIAAIFHFKKFSLKCENLQKIGAFKPRGVFNKLQCLQSQKKVVCTHSSGNNAGALAYASKKLGLKAKIVMPQNSPPIKQNAVKEYEGEIYVSGNTIKQREDLCQKIKKEFNATLIHPYNDPEIIAGQATCAKQIFESQEHYDYILCPIGGGGLMSGTLLSGRYFGTTKTQIIGVEPFLARDAFDSIKSKTIKPQYPPISIADGLRTSLGSITFKIIQELLTPENLILVSEEEIIEAMKLVMERMKLVIEPSSATVVAAVAKDKRFIGKKVCCIISGGNVDMSSLWASFRQKAKL